MTEPIQTAAITDAPNDDFAWLEELESDRALAWVKAQNEASLARLVDARFEEERAACSAILNAETQIPYVFQRADRLYNFWTDRANPRGVWRRTTMESYRTANPDWEVLLDVDALGRVEGESYVWQGCLTLPPAHRRGLVMLSRGGSDACLVREFDLTDKIFVEGGFNLPEAKTQLQWLDAETLLVSTSLLGEVTTSGYGRVVRRWPRGTRLADAPIVFQGAERDMGVFVSRDHDNDFRRIIYVRRTSFFEAEFHVEEDAGGRRQIDIPADATPYLNGRRLTVHLRSPWSIGGRVYPADALIATDLGAFLEGKRDFTVLFEPSERCWLQSWLSLADHVVIVTLDNVRSKVRVASASPAAWKVVPLAGLPDKVSINAMRLRTEDDDDRGEFLILVTDFLTPNSLLLCKAGEEPDLLKRLPAFFDADGLEVTQHEATSGDGTRIPYFQVAPRTMELDGSNPTRLTGYGGFLLPSLPFYPMATGKLWLEKGYVLVLANIRGGGEFGPAWHKAAMREGRRLAHDDFAAVARDLVARGVTRPDRLAIEGGSNGGLLVGNMLTRYPELFGAVACDIPLLDMRRYTKLLAGASWMAEYGDPDKPEDWAYLRTYSPYHLVEQGRRYPPILLTTTHRDDRVHPGHARKMAAKLQSCGHEALLYESLEGGHGQGADKEQVAFTMALRLAFIRQALGIGDEPRSAGPTGSAAPAGRPHGA